MDIKKYFSFAAIVVAMLCFTGCEDFEDDIYYKTNEAWATNMHFEILEKKADNTFKIRVYAPVVISELKNEEITQSEVMLNADNEEEKFTHPATMEQDKDNPILYYLVSDFDNIALNKRYYVHSIIKGKYIDSNYSASSFVITGRSLVKVKAVKPLLVAPDSVSLEIDVEDYKYLTSEEYAYMDINFYNAQNQIADSYGYEVSISKKDISASGKVIKGLNLSDLITDGNYRILVNNQASKDDVQECRVNIPRSTAAITNVKTSLDISGLHITGTLNKGNLACSTFRVFVSDKDNKTIAYKELDSNTTTVEFNEIYPPYDTDYNLSVNLKTSNLKPLDSKEISVKSDFTYYGADMGGDVLWAVCNAGATTPTGYGSLFYRSGCINGDGFWSLPSDDNFNALVNGSKRKWISKNNVYGWELTSISTGNILFFPAGNNNNYSSTCYYWLNNEIPLGNSDAYWIAFRSSYNGFNTFFPYRSESRNNRYYARYVISKDVVNATSIKLDKTSLTTYVGCNENLTATLLPGEISNTGVTWSSSNTNVATVANGIVTAVGLGKCTITVSTLNPNIKAKCEVTVESDAVDLGLSVKWRAFNYGATSPIDHGFQTKDRSKRDIWMTPTRDQYNELFQNCTYERTKINDVTCIRYTSKINGKSIVIPIGNYWTSTQSTSKSGSVYITYTGRITYLKDTGSGLPSFDYVEGSSSGSSGSETQAIWNAEARGSSFYIRQVCE